MSAKKSKEVCFEMRNVDDLIPYARNARTHSSEQVARIAGSIKEFGFMNPVIISQDGGILAGHGRVLAAKKLNLEKVPCVVETHLTEAQRRAYILADNKLALDAGWDNDMLRVELQELKDLDFDLGLTGFDDLEITNIFGESSESESKERAPLPTSNPEGFDKFERVIRKGEVWHLGDHRLICGSCEDEETVNRLLEEGKPNLMVTDPPYGVKLLHNDKSWEKLRQTGGHAYAGLSRQGQVLNDDRDDWETAYRLFPGNVAYIWHPHLREMQFVKDIQACGFKILSLIIWNKGHFALSRGNYHWKHEACIYAVREGEKTNWQGARDQCTVWDIKNINNLQEGAWGHGSQKPIECMLRPMLNNSAEGDWVYDPFLGSGTTIIAGETCGRRVMGCELSEKYADTIIRRFEMVTGTRCVRSDGVLYSDLVRESGQEWNSEEWCDKMRMFRRGIAALDTYKTSDVTADELAGMEEENE
jgi:DNA modification methylase